MLEIEEVVPHYKIIDDTYERTPNPYYAMNQDSVEIFNKFNDRFFCYVDDYGRLVCCEKEDNIV